MNTFWQENGTKVLGSVTAVLGTLASLIAAGAFKELLTPAAIGWLNIFVSLATAATGGATLARGFNNSAQAKVAQAMETAINTAPPKQGGFVRMMMLATLLAVGIPIMTVMHGCAQIGLAQPASFDQRLAYAVSQNAAVRDAAASALEAGDIAVDDAKRVLKITDEVRTALDAARMASGTGDVSTAEGRLQLATALLVELQKYLRTQS